jgi:hypothetical protein
LRYKIRKKITSMEIIKKFLGQFLQINWKYRITYRLFLYFCRVGKKSVL